MTAEEPCADAEKARTTALSCLARRDFSSGELADKLRAKAFDELMVVELIAALTREGILNDERYAQNYVAYHAGRGQGPLRIAADLRRRGLAAQLIDGALSGGPDWRALALKVSRAKFGPQPPGSWALKARQARFLLYRGFAADQIRAVTGADPEMTEET
jgi:regulatory protein